MSIGPRTQRSLLFPCMIGFTVLLGCGSGSGTPSQAPSTRTGDFASIVRPLAAPELDAEVGDSAVLRGELRYWTCTDRIVSCPASATLYDDTERPADFTWSSSDSTVVRMVSRGRFVAVGLGTAVIRLRTTCACLLGSDSVAVTVSAPIARVQVAPDTVQANTAGGVTIAAFTVRPLDALGRPVPQAILVRESATWFRWFGRSAAHDIQWAWRGSPVEIVRTRGTQVVTQAVPIKP